MRTLLLLILAFFPLFQTPQERIKTFRNSKRFSVEYDKFKDRTQVQVGPFVLSNGDLYMTARFLFPGENVKEPVPQFALWFQASAREWKFLKHRHLSVVADGERMGLGEGAYDGNLKRRGGTSESLGFLIPAVSFEKISKAQSVEIRVGQSELKLNDEHKEAFRDLYSLSR